MPPRRAFALATLAVLAFGVAAGAAARPRVTARGAAAPPRGIVIAAEPVPTDAPAAGAVQPRERHRDRPRARRRTARATRPRAAGSAGQPAATTPKPPPATTAKPPASTTPTPTAPSGAGSGSGGDPKPPATRHVWLVVLADHGPNDLLAAQAPYTATLRRRGLLLPRYRAVGPGGLANLVELVSGQAPTPEQRAGCPRYVDVAAGHGCVLPAGVESLPAALTAAGRPARAYVEDADNAAAQGDPCRHPPLGAPDPFAAPRPGDAYLTARDPLVYFHAIVDQPRCAGLVAGLPALVADAATRSRAPAFALVVPNACHDGRDAPCAPGAPAGPAAADAWLRAAIAPLLRSRAYADDGLVIVTADQEAGAADGGAPGALVLSAGVQRGGTVDAARDHVDLLRTIGDLFALPPLGAAAARDVHPLGAAVVPGSTAR